MFWNQKDLPQPPVSSYKATKRDFDLFKFRKALQEGIDQFQDSAVLRSEFAILSRVLYRMKMKFRSARDFKLLEKLKHCLDIYFSTNIGLHLKNIIELLPSRYDVNTYLPTKNMLYYVLVRLQGLVKLMVRTYDTCILTAEELNGRFAIGHFWKLFVILFALVSRLAILIKFNTKFLCKLYGKLLPYAQKLENLGESWLPPGYVLPPDLRTWLAVQWVYEEDFVDLTFESSNEVVDFFNLVDEDDDDVQFCDEYILLDTDKQIVREFKKLRPIKDILAPDRFRGFNINEDDIGDIIEIDDTTDLQERNLEEVNQQEVEDIGEEILPIPEEKGKAMLNSLSYNTKQLKPDEIVYVEESPEATDVYASISDSEVTTLDRQRPRQRGKSKRKNAKLVHERIFEDKVSKIVSKTKQKKLIKQQANYSNEASVSFLPDIEMPVAKKSRREKIKMKNMKRNMGQLKPKPKIQKRTRKQLETAGYLSLDTDVDIVKAQVLSPKKGRKRKRVRTPKKNLRYAR